MANKNVSSEQREIEGTQAQRPVALTVKIDNETYVRLSNLRASRRSTHQDILQQALKEYLDKQGV